MSNLSTFLFDLDGTLIDSTELIMSSFRYTMNVHLGMVPSEEEWRAGFGTPLRPQLARYARSEKELVDMTATYRAHNHEHHDRLVKPYSGIREVIAELKVRGSRMCIVTSKNKVGAERGLRHCALDGFFEALVTADDVTEHKPSPIPVTEGLSRLNADAGQAVFVGDSPHDCQAGRLAHVLTAGALWGPFTREKFKPYSPDYWLEHPHEILRLE
ncbi:MAG: pyrophosphatase PpaX [Acidobacteria bacterium]|nr:pyrophosphatase PpaX [Acidobacteriota bacterium]|tara:strand:- start:1935 stop:2576 length:642 start_codon:yes stop_codon:yes gene_type:complete